MKEEKADEMKYKKYLNCVYHLDSDDLNAFIDEHYYKTFNYIDRVSYYSFYQQLFEWATQKGIYVPSRRDISNALMDLGFQKGMGNVEGRSHITVIRGLIEKKYSL